MLERFTKERQRASKGAAFNLEDEEELTHYGQSLSKLDDFDNVGLGLDDDDEDRGVHMCFFSLVHNINDHSPIGQIDRDVVKKTHFGGFSDDEQEDEEDAVCILLSGTSLF
jgi:nucleolar protein 14